MTPCRWEGNRRSGVAWVCVTDIGVNATGNAGDMSLPIFGQPGTKCLISPAQFVKLFCCSRMAVNLLQLAVWKSAVLRLTQTEDTKTVTTITVIIWFSREFLFKFLKFKFPLYSFYIPLVLYRLCRDSWRANFHATLQTKATKSTAASTQIYSVTVRPITQRFHFWKKTFIIIGLKYIFRIWATGSTEVSK